MTRLCGGPEAGRSRSGPARRREGHPGVPVAATVAPSSDVPATIHAFIDANRRMRLTSRPSPYSTQFLNYSGAGIQFECHSSGLMDLETP